MHPSIEPMDVDKPFLEHFCNLKQVFLYLTDRCNLRCEYCLYKPNLAFQLRRQEISLPLVTKLLATFRQLGATKLSLIGGEPTLYDEEHGAEGLLDTIREAKNMGYQYVRMDTNGQFKPQLLVDPRMSLLDEISFSIDSHRADLNDVFRGEGTLLQAMASLKKAIAKGFKVDVTMCIHRGNIGRDDDGRLIVESTIQHLASLGINRLNLHPVLKMGIPRDTWTANATIEPHEWVEIRNEIMRPRSEREFPVPVRVPQRIVDSSEFDRNPGYYGYCSAKLGERVLVHPDGVIRCCALLIGTPYGVARYDDDHIVWDGSWTNELDGRSTDACTFCDVQRPDTPGMVPLCISFKPGQDEYVWNQELCWEKRKR